MKGDLVRLEADAPLPGLTLRSLAGVPGLGGAAMGIGASMLTVVMAGLRELRPRSAG